MTRITTTTFKSPLHEMTQVTPTCLWNDSASIQELSYSIEHGAVGATCNPVIVFGVLKKEMTSWKERIRTLMEDSPAATEEQISWQLVREISTKAAALLKPIFDAQRGRNGRLSIQTDPRFYRDSQAILAQAEEFSRLAPNMIVKIPLSWVSAGASERARTLRRWGRYARSWSGAWTTGSKWWLKKKTLRSTPAIWSGPVLRCSRRPTRFSVSAGIVCDCCRQHSAITCTGVN